MTISYPLRMKIQHKINQAFALVFGLAFSASSFSQTLNLERIDASPSLGEVCIDTPPLNDNYGWNGSCTCRVDRTDYFEFGWTRFATSGDTLVVGSVESPGSCRDSGTASVYSTGFDTTKRGELVSSVREQNDRFAKTIAASNDYIAVGANKTITLFGINDLIERTVLHIDALGLSGSFRTVRFVDSALLAETDSHLLVYSSDDWSVIQRIEIAPDAGQSASFERQFTVNESNQLAVHRFYGTATSGAFRVDLYNQNSNGTFTLAQTIAEPSPADTLNGIRPDLQFDQNHLIFTIRKDRSITMITYLRDTNGSWYNSNKDWTVDLRNVPSFQAALADGDLVSQSAEQATIQFYSFDAATGWTMATTLPLPRANPRFVFNSDLIIKEKRIYWTTDAMEGDSAVLFEKDNSGVWRNSAEFTLPNAGRTGLMTKDALILGSYTSDFYYANLSGNTQSGICVDSDGDGFGWNGTETCTPDVPATCIDSDGDGWGWDGTQSCTVTSTGGNTECDYTDADLYGGWGWNSALMQSCPPLEEPLSADGCDYSNATINGGWGWNLTTLSSCPPRS